MALEIEVEEEREVGRPIRMKPADPIKLTEMYGIFWMGKRSISIRMTITLAFSYTDFLRLED